MGGEMLNKTDLKNRGWTDSVISKHLGEPDALKDNPYYKNGPKIKLYDINRVIEMEQNQTVVKALEGAKKRSESGKRRALEQAKKLKEYIQSLKIEIPIMTEKKLIEEACHHYNLLWEYRGQYDKHATPSADKDFLRRIAVNFLRHEFTDYDQELERMFGKSGSINGKQQLKDKVLDHISETYPLLRDECNSQKNRLHQLPESVKTPEL